MSQKVKYSDAPDRMHLLWSIGNSWTFLGMVVAVCTVFFGWLDVFVAFLLPIPGMIMMAIGSNRYQRAETDNPENPGYTLKKTYNRGGTNK